MDRTATCRCGQLRAHVTGEPTRISVCHCAACRSRTGSALAWNTTWPEDRVTIEGRWTRWTRQGDTGLPIDYDFCPDCGATVAYRVAMRAGTVSVPAGAFGDPDFPPPFIQVYTDGKVPWLDVEIPADRQPGATPVARSGEAA